MSIRTALGDMGNIHLSQSKRVMSAANQAHLRNKTRSIRTYQKTDSAIRRQISKRSLV